METVKICSPFYDDSINIIYDEKKNSEGSRMMKKSFSALVSLLCIIALNIGALQQQRPEVPFVPTPERVVAEMLRMADVNRDDLIYDLGCGDGRIVVTAAKKFGCRGVGIGLLVTPRPRSAFSNWNTE